ncbi:MAG TPA: HD domain-containing protein [Thermoflexia bacterium]|jgi:3'-5' exoribonuclease|nr:HD domain-containing protein [Thermoflexia bacterium]
MKEQFVRDLRPGDRVLSFFLVRHKQLEPFRDRTRGEFLTLILADRTGEILARVWEDAPAVAETFEEGQVVKVLGRMEEYLDRWQVIVEKIRPAKEEEYDLADFLPATERDVEEMLREVRQTIEEVKDPHLHALLLRFFDDPDFVARFSRAPAARRVHHAYLGGLLEHTLEVVHLCRSVMELYPQIHRDLLLTGALLHDVGKTREFHYETEITYSDEGRLLGHVVLSLEMVDAALAEVEDFPEELALRLRHMIVSHHGRYEWGSPRRPKTLEAAALHYVENLSAQVNRFHRIIATRRDRTRPWTEYDTLLRRFLYAGREGEEDLSVEEEGQLT